MKLGMQVGLGPGHTALDGSHRSKNDIGNYGKQKTNPWL